MQPQEVEDAAQRIAFLALSEPADRPLQNAPHCKISSKSKVVRDDESQQHDELNGDTSSSSYRFYDAVGTYYAVSMLTFIIVKGISLWQVQKR